MSGRAALDTIVAPATPVGRSALAIVRMDGPRSAEILAELTDRPPGEPRRAVHLRLADGAEVIDDCVVVRYAAPHSFTGNDLVEVTLHGNPLLIDRLVTAAVRRGARVAEPGEFTERAVLNGKLDLTQAEAVADLIAARTPLQAKLSLQHLEGELSRTASALRAALLDVISRLEAALDFSDEGYEFIEHRAAVETVRAAIASCESLLATYERGRATTAGINAVILGAPNAGKSTLLNRLVGSDRAIVTSQPGTTRDILRETIEIGGLPVTLSDTAGLRETADAVEEIGVTRARGAAATADLVLYLIDASIGILDSDRLELAALSGPEVLRVFSKVDLHDAPPGEVGISVATGSGVEALLTRLDELVRGRFAVPESSPALVNMRQRAAIEETREALGDAADSLASKAEEQIVLVDLYRAASALGSLSGAIANDEIYDAIFARFCIGK